MIEVQQKSISSVDGVEWVEQAPQDGDIVREWLGQGGARHFVQYTYRQPKPELITMDKMHWLRQHLGESAERSIRLHIAERDGSRDTQQLETFIAMVDARSDLILSDAGYAEGVLLIRQMELCDQDKADHLLALGDHKAK